MSGMAPIGLVLHAGPILSGAPLMERAVPRDGGAWPQGPIRIRQAVFQTRNGSRPFRPPPGCDRSRPFGRGWCSRSGRAGQGFRAICRYVRRMTTISRRELRPPSAGYGLPAAANSVL